jgi:5'-3' exonuclease
VHLINVCQALAPIGWEGDDVIATICGRMAVYAGGGAGLVAVVSNDSDMQQLLRKDKVVWVSQMPAKSQKYPDRIVLETVRKQFFTTERVLKRFF